MQKSILLRIVIFVVSFQIGSISFAYVYPYSVSSWPPEKVNELSQKEAHELNSEKCLVTAYRRNNGPPSHGNSPEKQDEMMVTRGEFAAKGQTDLIVLCESLDNGKAFIQVIWGGPAQCANKLLMSNVSRFSIEQVALHYSYYIEYLKGLTPSETLRYRDMWREAFRQSEEDWASMGLTTKQWILEDAKTPELEHDTLWFEGRSTLAFYCHDNKWIQLYDHLQDGEP
ncbi:MAG: hypothetical protein AB2806_07850 [Candidatus Thiodiazotropha sp.]